MVLRMGVVQSTSSVVFFGIDIMCVCAIIAASLEDSLIRERLVVVIDKGHIEDSAVLARIVFAKFLGQFGCAGRSKHLSPMMSSSTHPKSSRKCLCQSQHLVRISSVKSCVP